MIGNKTTDHPKKIYRLAAYSCSSNYCKVRVSHTKENVKKVGGEILGFPENLSRLQIQHGETNYRLAKSIGASQTSIQNWKDGKNVPHKLYLDAVAKHYGVTADELMADSQTRE